LITARGGSKRIPKKNIRVVGGKPLIAWTIEEALKSKHLSRVVVSTDSPEIASISKEYGAEVPFLRPAELAEDNSAHVRCVFHALDMLGQIDKDCFDAVCLLQPTSPLRLVEDIDGLLGMTQRRRPAAMVSVCEAVEHPYFARSLDAEGRLSPYITQDVEYPSKQNLPKVYFVNGAVYFNTVVSLRKDVGFYPAGVLGYEMPLERSLQIDCQHELNVGDLLLRQRAGDCPSKEIEAYEFL